MSQPNPVPVPNQRQKHVYAFSPHKRQRIKFGSNEWNALYEKYGEPQPFRTVSRISKGAATGNSIVINVFFAELLEGDKGKLFSTRETNSGALVMIFDLDALSKISPDEKPLRSGMPIFDGHFDFLLPRISKAIRDGYTYLDDEDFDPEKPNTIEINLLGHGRSDGHSSSIFIGVGRRGTPTLPPESILDVIEAITSSLMSTVGYGDISQNTDIIISVKACESLGISIDEILPTKWKGSMTTLQQSNRRTVSDQLIDKINTVPNLDNFHKSRERHVYTLDSFFATGDVFAIRAMNTVQKVCRRFNVEPNIKVSGTTGVSAVVVSGEAELYGAIWAAHDSERGEMRRDRTSIFAEKQVGRVEFPVHKIARFWPVDSDDEIKDQDAEEVLTDGSVFFDFEPNTKATTMIDSATSLAVPNSLGLSTSWSQEYSKGWHHTMGANGEISEGGIKHENAQVFSSGTGISKYQALTPAQMIFSTPAETLDRWLMSQHRFREHMVYMLSDTAEILESKTSSTSLRHKTIALSRAVRIFCEFELLRAQQNQHISHIRKALQNHDPRRRKQYDEVLHKVNDGIQKYLDEKLNGITKAEDRLKIIYETEPEQIESIAEDLESLRLLEKEVEPTVRNVQERMAMNEYSKYLKGVKERINKLRKAIDEKRNSISKGLEDSNAQIEDEKTKPEANRIIIEALEYGKTLFDAKSKQLSLLEQEIGLSDLALSEEFEELKEQESDYNRDSAGKSELEVNQILNTNVDPLPISDRGHIELDPALIDKLISGLIPWEEVDPSFAESTKKNLLKIKKSTSPCAAGSVDRKKRSSEQCSNIDVEHEKILQQYEKYGKIADKTIDKISKLSESDCAQGVECVTKDTRGEELTRENIQEDLEDVRSKVSNEHATVLQEMHKSLQDSSYSPKIVGDWKPDKTPILETKNGRPIDPEESKINARKYRNSAGEAIMLLNIAQGVASRDLTSVATGAGMLALPRVSGTIIEGIDAVSKGVENSVAKVAIGFTKGTVAHLPMASLSAFSLVSDIKSLVDGTGNAVETSMDIAFNTGMLVMTTLDIIGMDTGPVGDLITLPVLVASRALAGDEAVEKLREEIPITTEQADDEWRRAFWGMSGYSSQVQKEIDRLRSNERRFDSMANLMVNSGYEYVAFPLTTELNYIDTVYHGYAVGGATSNQVPSYDLFGVGNVPDVRPCSTFERPRNPILQNYYPSYLYFTEKAARPDLVPLSSVEKQVSQAVAEYEGQMGPGGSSDSQNPGGAYFAWKENPAGTRVTDYGQPRYTRGGWVRKPEFAAIPDDLSGPIVGKYTIHSVPMSEHDDLIKSSTVTIPGHTETEDCTNARNKVQSTKAVTVSGPSTGSDVEKRQYYETVYQEEAEGIYRDGPSKTRSHNAITIKNDNPTKRDMLVVLSGKVFYRTNANTMPHTFWIPPDGEVSWQPHDGETADGWHDVAGPANAVSTLMVDTDINDNGGKFSFPGGVSISLGKKFCDAHNNQLGIVLGEASDIIDTETGKVIFSISGDVSSIAVSPEVCFKVLNIDQSTGKNIKLLQSPSGAKSKVQYDNYFEQVGDCPSPDGNNYVLDLSTAWPLRRKIVVNLADRKISDGNSGEVLMEISGKISRVIKRFHKSEIDVVIPSPGSSVMIENPSQHDYDVLRNHRRLLDKLEDIAPCNADDKDRCAISRVGVPDAHESKAIMHLLLSKDVRTNELTTDSTTTPVSVIVPPDLFPQEDLVIDYKSGKITTAIGKVLFSTNGLLREVEVLTPTENLQTRKYELLNVDHEVGSGAICKKFKVMNENGVKFDAPGSGLVKLTKERSWPNTAPGTIELSRPRGAIANTNTGEELIFLPALMVDCRGLDIVQGKKCDVLEASAVKPSPSVGTDTKSLSKDDSRVTRVVRLYSFPDASLDIERDIVLDVRSRLVDGASLIIDFGSNSVIECDSSGTSVRTLQLGEKAIITGIIANTKNVRIQNVGQSKNRDVFIVGEEVTVELNNAWPKNTKVNVDLATGVISDITTGEEIMKLSVERGRVVDSTRMGGNAYTPTEAVSPYAIPYIKKHIMLPATSPATSSAFPSESSPSPAPSLHGGTATPANSKASSVTEKGGAGITLPEGVTQTTPNGTASTSPNAAQSGVVRIPQDTTILIEPGGYPLNLDVGNGGVATVRISQVGAHVKKSKQVINLANTKKGSAITLALSFGDMVQLKDIRKIKYSPDRGGRLSIIFNKNGKASFPKIVIHNFSPGKNIRLQLSCGIIQDVSKDGGRNSGRKSIIRQAAIEPIILTGRGMESFIVKNFKVDLQSLPGEGPWDLARAMKHLQKQNSHLRLVQASWVSGGSSQRGGSSVVLHGTANHEIFTVPSALEGSAKKSAESALVLGVGEGDMVVLGKGRKHTVIGSIEGSLLDFSKITSGIHPMLMSLKGCKSPSATGRNDLLLVLTKADGEVLSRVVVRRKSPDKSQGESVSFRVLLSRKSPVQNIQYSYNAAKDEMNYKMIFDYGSNALEINNFNEKISLLADSLRPYTALKLNGISEIKFYQYGGDSLYLEGTGIGKDGGRNHLGIMILHANQWMKDIRSGNLQFGVFMNEPKAKYQNVVDEYKKLGASLAGAPSVLYKTSWLADKLSSIEPLMHHVQNQLGVERYVVSPQDTDNAGIIMIKPSSQHNPDTRVGIVDARNLVPASIASIKVERNLVLVFNDQCSKKPIFVVIEGFYNPNQGRYILDIGKKNDLNLSELVGKNSSIWANTLSNFAAYSMPSCDASSATPVGTDSATGIAVHTLEISSGVKTTPSNIQAKEVEEISEIEDRSGRSKRFISGQDPKVNSWLDAQGLNSLGLGNGKDAFPQSSSASFVDKGILVQFKQALMGLSSPAKKIASGIMRDAWGLIWGNLESNLRGDLGEEPGSRRPESGGSKLACYYPLSGECLRNVNMDDYHGKTNDQATPPQAKACGSREKAAWQMVRQYNHLLSRKDGELINLNADYGDFARVSKVGEISVYLAGNSESGRLTLFDRGGVCALVPSWIGHLASRGECGVVDNLHSLEHCNHSKTFLISKNSDDNTNIYSLYTKGSELPDVSFAYPQSKVANLFKVANQLSGAGEVFASGFLHAAAEKCIDAILPQLQHGDSKITYSEKGRDMARSILCHGLMGIIMSNGMTYKVVWEVVHRIASTVTSNQALQGVVAYSLVASLVYITGTASIAETAVSIILFGAGRKTCERLSKLSVCKSVMTTLENMARPTEVSRALRAYFKRPILEYAMEPIAYFVDLMRGSPQTSRPGGPGGHCIDEVQLKNLADSDKKISAILTKWDTKGGIDGICKDLNVCLQVSGMRVLNQEVHDALNNLYGHSCLFNDITLPGGFPQEFKDILRCGIRRRHLATGGFQPDIDWGAVKDGRHATTLFMLYAHYSTKAEFINYIKGYIRMGNDKQLGILRNAMLQLGNLVSYPQEDDVGFFGQISTEVYTRNIASLQERLQCITNIVFSKSECDALTGIIKQHNSRHSKGEDIPSNDENFDTSDMIGDAKESRPSIISKLVQAPSCAESTQWPLSASGITHGLNEPSQGSGINRGLYRSDRKSQVDRLERLGTPKYQVQRR